MTDKEAPNDECLLCDQKVAIRTIPSRSMDTLVDIIMVSCSACGYDVQLDAESDDDGEVIEGLIEISYLEGQALLKAKALMDADQPTLEEEIGRLDPNDAILMARVLGSMKTTKTVSAGEHYTGEYRSGVTDSMSSAARNSMADYLDNEVRADREGTFEESDLEAIAKVERVRQALRSRFLPN